MAYFLFAYFLIGCSGAVELALWTASPMAATALVLIFTRQRLTAAILLALMWVLGAVLLLWGLVFNPGDYNHLIVIFLPIYEFGLLAAVLLVVGMLSFAGFTKRGPR